MAGTTDIKITYVNDTGESDFDVVVFTKNFNENTPKVYYAAWKVFRTQNEATFVYPVSMEVGARHGSSTKVLVLKSALSTFFRVLEGAFKHFLR